MNKNEIIEILLKYSYKEIDDMFTEVKSKISSKLKDIVDNGYFFIKERDDYYEFVKVENAEQRDNNGIKITGKNVSIFNGKDYFKINYDDTYYLSPDDVQNNLIVLITKEQFEEVYNLSQTLKNQFETGLSKIIVNI